MVKSFQCTIEIHWVYHMAFQWTWIIFKKTSQAYTKSLCATALTGAHLQGALPLDKVPAMRALVIGLGAGSIPLWLEHTFSKDKMEPWSFQQDREFF